MLRYQSADKYQTLYSYFRNGWLKQVRGQEWVEGAWANRVQVDYAYDELGRVTTRTNADSDDVVTAYTYNDRGETKSITHGGLYSLAHTRDGAGNPLEIAFGGGEFDKAYTNANVVRYGYDVLSRLTNENWGHLSGGSWVSDHSDTWAYDWVGNRDPSSNDYNQADMLDANDGYLYDYRGNLEYKRDSSSYPRTRFYYNPDNLLDRVDDVVDAQTTNTTNITWDADWQRLKLARGSDMWEMVYDATARIPAVLLSKDYVDSTPSCIFCVREPGGELLASFDAAGTPSYHHFDGLGSTVLVTDGSGRATDNFTYGAWGNVLNTPTNDQKPYQYVGRLGYHVHTLSEGTALAGLLQLGVRLYDPALGRFGQRDRMEEGLISYQYVAGNPLSYIDADGLKKKKPRVPTNPGKKKPPRPRPRPRPGKGIGGKIKGAIGKVGGCFTAVCSAAILHHIGTQCGHVGDWDRECVCTALETLLEGLDDLWDESNPIEKIGVAIGNFCASTAYDAVDAVVQCD